MVHSLGILLTKRNECLEWHWNVQRWVDNPDKARAAGTESGNPIVYEVEYRAGGFVDGAPAGRDRLDPSLGVRPMIMGMGADQTFDSVSKHKG